MVAVVFTVTMIKLTKSALIEINKWLLLLIAHLFIHMTIKVIHQLMSNIRNNVLNKGNFAHIITLIW